MRYETAPTTDADELVDADYAVEVEPETLARQCLECYWTKKIAANREPAVEIKEIASCTGIAADTVGKILDSMVDCGSIASGEVMSRRSAQVSVYSPVRKLETLPGLAKDCPKPYYRRVPEEFFAPLKYSLFGLPAGELHISEEDLIDEAGGSLPIAEHSLLLPEQTLEIARVIQNSADQKEVDRAIEQLVAHNIKLAFWGAHRANFERSYMPFTDVVQAALMGVGRAAQTFDPERGLTFSTYAEYWIRTYIRGETAKFIGVPRGVFDRFTATYRSAMRLKEQLGHMPSIVDLAYDLNVQPRTIASQMDHRGRVAGEASLWLDVEIGDGSNTVIDQLNDMAVASRSECDWPQVNAGLQKLSEHLDEFEFRCLEQILMHEINAAQLGREHGLPDSTAKKKFHKVRSLLRHPYFGIATEADPTLAWQDQARCHTEPNDLVISASQKTNLTRDAKKFCSPCPVKMQCAQLATAGEFPVTAGVWGGKPVYLRGTKK